MQLPSDFIYKFEYLLKEEAPAFFHTYEEKKRSGLRINPLKLSVEEWKKITPFALEKVPFVQNAYYYDPEKDQPGKHPYHSAGLYYIQEPSAMFVAEQLAPESGEKVLDLCAAPGGKTTQLAGMMKQGGLLVANEINSKRAKALSENIERLGITNALVTNETPERLAERFDGYFDRILVDAPCSGEGMFRKDADAIRYWSEEHVEACARQQSAILDSAYLMLKEGGTLVYSTCTFSPEENEQSIERFLAKYPDLELMPIEKNDGIQAGKPEWSKQGDVGLSKAARLWPHHVKGEGHFVAKVQKTARTEPANVRGISSNTGKSQLKDFELFVNQTLQGREFQNFYLFNQQLYSLPDDCPNFQGLKVVRPGLHLGELKKNRFEPNHALALSLTKEEVNHTFPLTTSSDDWFHYLKGETLASGKDRGWILVTIDGYPIGWEKKRKAF